MEQYIDTHVHFWKLSHLRYPWLEEPQNENIAVDYLPSHFLSTLPPEIQPEHLVHIQADFDHSQDPVLETEWLEELNKKFGIPSAIVGYADLRHNDVAHTLDRHLSSALFRGIRQIVTPSPHYPDLLKDPHWQRGLERLAERSLSFELLVHPSQLEQASKVFAEHPDNKLILGHLGLPGLATDLNEWKDHLLEFQRRVPWAYLKLSALAAASPEWDRIRIYEILSTALEIFGPEKTMFGSDFPVDGTTISYQEHLDLIQSFLQPFSALERNQILRENAATFYELKRLKN